MTDFLSLVKNTTAYQTLCQDKKNGCLSHAYLVVNPDQTYQTEYLKIFAKIILCEQGFPCNQCRKCRLIDDLTYSDLIVYPKEGQTMSVEDVSMLIEESYIKPLEDDKKVFVISDGQNMSASVQNKLLKTLEEPPENTYFIIGVTKEYTLLPTIKSRMKKVEIQPFSKEQLFSALKGEMLDVERLNNAITCSDGTVGKIEKLYRDDDTFYIIELVKDLICNMQSSADVLAYSNKILSLKDDLNEFLSLLQIAYRDMLVNVIKQSDLVRNKELLTVTSSAKGYTMGALVNAIEKINEAEKRKKFNANPTMLVEWLLFQILEGKYKWQK